MPERYNVPFTEQPITPSEQHANAYAPGELLPPQDRFNQGMENQLGGLAINSPDGNAQPDAARQAPHPVSAARPRKKYGVAESRHQAAEQLDAGAFAAGHYDSAWQSPDFRNVVFTKIAQVAGSSREQRTPPSDDDKAMIQKVFAGFNLTHEQSRDMWNAWSSFNTGYVKPSASEIDSYEDPARLERYKSMVYDNLTAMNYINAHNPEGLGRLYARDGIHNFGRYNPRRLVGQSVDNPGKPDQVSLSAVTDWANSSKDMHGKLDAINGEKGYKKTIRIIEAGGSQEARERLEAIAEQHGPIKNLVLTGHSIPDAAGNVIGLELGKGADGLITTERIRGTESEPAFLDNKIVARGGDITIIGCKTSDTIAYELAEVTGTRVHASDELVLGLKRDASGNLLFRTTKGDKPAIVHGPGKMRARARRLHARLKNAIRSKR